MSERATPSAGTGVPNFSLGQQERRTRSLSFDRPSVVQGFRGTTSPWSNLVAGTPTSLESESVQSFRQTVSRLAEEERSSKLSGSSIHIDLLDQYPFLTRDRALLYARDYALAAPFPILDWIPFRQILERVLDTHQASRWGQIACILVVRTVLDGNGEADKTRSISPLERRMLRGESRRPAQLRMHVGNSSKGRVRYCPNYYWSMMYGPSRESF